MSIAVVGKPGAVGCISVDAAQVLAFTLSQHRGRAVSQTKLAYWTNSRRVTLAAAWLLASVAVLPQSAAAMSAFAAGIPDNVATQGLAVGDGYNYSTREGAEARALQECLAQQDAPPDTRALCKVVAYFDNKCLAVSLDPQAGTPGYGWAIGDTAAEANDQAIEHCHESAGADRAGYCIVSLTHCDTNSSGPK